MTSRISPQLIIFDFDGVIADSETIACNVLAQFVTELGHPISLDAALQRFMGKRIGDVTAAVEGLVGRPLPGFADDLQSRTLAAFQKELREVPGFTTFISTYMTIAHCIASSSAPARIVYCMALLGVSHFFDHNVFSAEAVERGKPFPDIFLHAARSMGVQPKECLVIEDSPGGVRAAVSAGMPVIGLLAASHIRPSQETALIAAGATFIAHGYDAVDRLLAER